LEVSQRELDTDDAQGTWKAIWGGRETRMLKEPFGDIQYGQQSYRYATEAEAYRLRKAFEEAGDG
jgi:hypothetical protein